MSKKWRFLIYAIILLGYYFFLMLSPALYSTINGDHINEIKVTGHRGAAGYAPENTMTSIQKALSMRLERIEIDIHQSKDDVVVLLHDERIDRTSNGNGLVDEYSFAELKALDFGSYFDEGFKGEKIPSLEEALQLVNGQSELVIEFKYGNERYPFIEEHVIDLINQYDASSWVIIHSFNTEVLEAIYKKAPNIRLHKLLIANLRFTNLFIGTGLEVFKPQDFPYIEEYSIHYYFANRSILQELKSLGKKVNVWTMNDDEKSDNYIRLGVDGIISDYPDLIQ